MITDIIEKIRPASMVDLLPPGTFDEAFANGDDWAPVQYAYYWALGRLFRPKRIFEIGVLGGASMASMMLGAGADCFGMGWDIEAYRPGTNAIAKKLWADCDLESRTTLERFNSQSPVAHRMLPVGVELFHVDGDHGLDGALHDLGLALASGAQTILFDDIYNTNTSCKEAADIFLKRYADRIVHSEILPTTTGLLVIKMAP